MATFDPLGLNVKIEQDRWDRAGQQAAAYEQGVIAEIEALNRRILAQQKMMAQQKKGRGADPASETRSVSSSVTTKSGGKKKEGKGLTDAENKQMYGLMLEYIRGNTADGYDNLTTLLSNKVQNENYDYEKVMAQTRIALDKAWSQVKPRERGVESKADALAALSEASEWLASLAPQVVGQRVTPEEEAAADAIIGTNIENIGQTGETRSVTSKSTREVPTERAKQIRAARDTDEWRALHAALENDGIIQEAEEAAWAEANPGSKTLKQMLIDDFIEDTMLTSLADSADLRASIARDREKLRELESKSISSADSVEERTQRGMAGQWKAYEAMTGNDRVRANAAIRAASGRWTPRPKGVSEEQAETGVRQLLNLRGGKLVRGAQSIANGIFPKDRERADGLMSHLLERVSKKLGDERKQAQPTTEQALQEIDMSGVSYDIQSGQGQIDKAAEEKREAERRAEEARRRRAAEARRRREAELARQAELEALQEGGYSFPGFGTGEMLEQEAGSYSFPGFGTGEMLEDSSVKSQRSTPKAQPRPAETQETIPYRLVPAIPGAERFAEIVGAQDSSRPYASEAMARVMGGGNTPYTHRGTPRSEGDYWHRNYGVPPLRPTESGPAPAPAAAPAPAPAAPYVISDAATAANFQSWQDRPSGVGIDPRLPGLNQAAPSAPEVSMVPAPAAPSASYQSPYEIGSGEMLYAPPAQAEMPPERWPTTFPTDLRSGSVMSADPVVSASPAQSPVLTAGGGSMIGAAPRVGATLLKSALSAAPSPYRQAEMEALEMEEPGPSAVQRRIDAYNASVPTPVERGRRLSQAEKNELQQDFAGALGAGFAAVDAPSIDRAEETIKINRQVPFVRRIIHADRMPVLQNSDGSVSTHLLATAGGGPGEPVFVYPQLQLINGQWVKESNPDLALQRGNVIYFNSFEEAEEFARGSWKPIAGQAPQLSYEEMTWQEAQLQKYK